MAIRSTPTGYVNLQRYLEGNQGLAGKMAGNVTEGIGVAQDETTRASENQATTGIQNAAQSSANRANNIVTGIQSTPSSVLGEAQDFTKQQYQNVDTSGQIGAINAAQAATQEELKKAGSDSAYQTQALQKQYGKQTPYSSGFATLDQFLVGASPSGQQALKSNIEKIGAKSADISKSAIGNINKAQEKAKSDFAAQQQKVIDTARKQANLKTTAAVQEENAMNKPITNPTSDIYKYQKGTQKKASFADVLDPNELADLRALTELGGWQWDPRQEQKTFTMGTLLPDVVKKAGSGKFRG
jgi:hypothetical protein